MNQSFLRFLRWSWLYNLLPKPSGPVSKCLQTKLNKGDIVFDIGANCGATALEISGIIGRKGYVFAFEPNPKMFEQCKIIEQKNLFQNIKFFNYGIGSDDTQKPFFIDISDSSQASTFDSLLLGTEKKLRGSDVFFETKAQVKRLDDLDLPSPNLLKLDVEGSELEALRGAKRIIAKDRPIIIFEFFFNDRDQRFEKRKKELMEFFDNLSYRVEIFNKWSANTADLKINKSSSFHEFVEYTGCDLLATPK